MGANILLINTGGTIAMAATKVGFAPKAGLLEQALDGLRRDGMQSHISLTAFTPLIDSANASFADWNRIAKTIAQAHDRYDGFIVTHGTDTLAFTSAALCFALEGLAKPVILTGSMVPLGIKGSDGAGNLIDAIAAAETAPPGVWVQFAGQRLHGARIRKVHSQAHGAFSASDNSAIPPLQVAPNLIRHVFGNPDLVILSMAPGQSVKAMTAALALCDGGVLRVFGAGTLPDDAGLAAALHAAHARGIPMIAVSQSAEGGVRLGTYAAGNLLREAGVIDGADMTPEAAYAKLAHVLSLPEPDRAARLHRTLCGESQ
jgi:L-asparaginase